MFHSPGGWLVHMNWWFLCSLSSRHHTYSIQKFAFLTVGKQFQCKKRKFHTAKWNLDFSMANLSSNPPLRTAPCEALVTSGFSTSWLGPMWRVAMSSGFSSENWLTTNRPREWVLQFEVTKRMISNTKKHMSRIYSLLDCAVSQKLRLTKSQCLASFSHQSTYMF